MNRVTPGLRPGDRMRTARGLEEWADAAIAKLYRDMDERARVERERLAAEDRLVFAHGGPGVASYVSSTAGPTRRHVDAHAVYDTTAKPRRRWWQRKDPHA